MTAAANSAPLFLARDWRFVGLAYGVAVCVAQLPTFAATAATWATSSIWHHGFLIIPISLWLILREGPAARAAPTLPALAALAAACTLWLFGRAANANIIEQTAFVLTLIAGAALLYGWATARRWRFALLFLFFVVPFGESLAPALQSLAAASSAALLGASGLDTELQGLVIEAEGRRFVVDAACSGLNFLLAATIVALLFAKLTLVDWPRRIGFVAFALALALIANILRTYLVILAATLTDGRVAADHVAFGWVFYALLLIALIGVGRRFANAPPRQPAPRQDYPLARASPALLGAAAILTASAAYAALVVDHPPAREFPRSLPYFEASGWRIVSADPGWKPHAPGSDRQSVVAYVSGDDAVQLAVAWYAYDRPGAEAAAAKGSDGESWGRIGARDVPALAFGAPRRLRVATVENAAGAKLETATLYWSDDRLFADRRSLKLHQAMMHLRGRKPHAGAIVVAARDLETMQSFFLDIEPFDAWRARLEQRQAGAPAASSQSAR